MNYISVTLETHTHTKQAKSNTQCGTRTLSHVSHLTKIFKHTDNQGIIFTPAPSEDNQILTSGAFHRVCTTNAQ